MAGYQFIQVAISSRLVATKQHFSTKNSIYSIDLGIFFIKKK